jgi:hypothetical protein
VDVKREIEKADIRFGPDWVNRLAGLLLRWQAR